MDDWQTGKSVVECLKYALQKNHLTDVQFRFTEEEPVVSLSAHRLVLSLRSPVFEAMFYGSLSNGTSTVDITDLDSSAFSAMLRYMYTDYVKLLDEDVMEVMRCSHKYCVPDLTDKCSKFLSDTICTSNVCRLLENAALYGVKDLQHCCLVYIDACTKDVLKSEGFKKLSQSNLGRILSANTLQADEILIYKAVVAWAEAECKRQSLDPTVFANRRKVAEPLIKLIRFPLMPPMTFSDEIAGTAGLLTQEEIIQIFQMFNSSYSVYTDFSRIPRKENVCLKIQRFQENGRCRFCYQGIEDKFQFTSDRELVLTGASFKGSIQRCGCSGVIKGSLQVLDYSKGETEPVVLGERPIDHTQGPPPEKTNFGENSSKDVLFEIHVEFSEPIFVLPTNTYGVHLVIAPNYDECECNEICDCYDLVSNRQPWEQFRFGRNVAIFRNSGEAIIKTLKFNYWR